MRSKVFFFLGLFALAVAIASCNRGIDKDTILAMPDGASKDSALLYYHTGLTKGTMLVAVDTFYVNTIAESSFKKNRKESVKIAGSDYQLAVDDFRGPQVLPGDSLLILGGFKQTAIKKGTLKKDYLQSFIQIRIFRNGKKIADGWNHNKEFYMASPKASTFWNTFFSNNTAELILNLLFFSLAFVIIFGIWKFIFKRISDPFWDDSTIITKRIYYFLSILLAFFFFLLKLDDSLFISLHYEPNFFAHWSEYPFFLKCMPFIFGFWILSIPSMLVEMIRKYSTLWLILYYPGVLSVGALFIGLIMLVSGLVYVALPSIIAFAVLAAISGGGSGSNGGGGGSNKEDNTYYFTDSNGGKYLSEVDRDNHNKKN